MGFMRCTLLDEEFHVGQVAREVLPRHPIEVLFVGQHVLLHDPDLVLAEGDIPDVHRGKTEGFRVSPPEDEGFGQKFRAMSGLRQPQPGVPVFESAEFRVEKADSFK